MKRKRNTKTQLLILLRKLGMLCKKTEPARRIRVSHTVWPDRASEIESQRHVWVETKKMPRKSCQFNSATMSCVCGVTSVEQFAQNCNPTSNQ